MQAALAALTRRQRTSSEIRDLLRRRGHSQEECAATVARLEELGYVDDLAYACAFAGTVARSKGWGPRRVRQELARRGVEASVIDQGLARAGEEGASPEANLQAALDKLIRSRGLPASRRERDRMAAALARRGFDAGAIHAALDAAGSGEDGLPEDPGISGEEG